MSVWIRGNLFIPDARRFWIRPSAKFLISYLKKNPVDALVSTGPPHTTHLIALRVRKKINIPWIADFRDPWTQIDFYDQLHLTNWADAKHKQMEKQVLKNADRVVTVSWHWADDLKKIGGREVVVITNGFDEDDYKGAKPGSDQKFSICHVGSLNADRNPHALWEALGEMCNENERFREDLLIRLIGKNDISVYESLEKNKLTSNLERIDYLPHSEVSREQQKAAVLLLPLNNTPNVLGIIPGKLFEYLAAQRPVLVIGAEDGDSARIIHETGAGVVCGFEEKEKMKEEIGSMYMRFKSGHLGSSMVDVRLFSRKSKAADFSNLMQQLT